MSGWIPTKGLNGAWVLASRQNDDLAGHAFVATYTAS
jgi:hypothetical protein